MKSLNLHSDETSALRRAFHIVRNGVLLPNAREELEIIIRHRLKRTHPPTEMKKMEIFNRNI